jgi:hypothetical protein
VLIVAITLCLQHPGAAHALCLDHKMGVMKSACLSYRFYSFSVSFHISNQSHLLSQSFFCLKKADRVWPRMSLQIIHRLFHFIVNRVYHTHEKIQKGIKDFVRFWYLCKIESHGQFGLSILPKTASFS